MNKVFINELLHNILINEFAVYNSNIQVLMHPENCVSEKEITEEMYSQFIKETKTALINLSKTANKIASEIKYLENEKYIPPKLVKKITTNVNEETKEK